MAGEGSAPPVVVPDMIEPVPDSPAPKAAAAGGRPGRAAGAGRAPTQATALGERGAGPGRCGAPVLVTGAAGFIGAAVTRRLAERGVRVIALDDLSAGDASRLDGLDAELVVGDVRDRALLADLLAERPSAVLHLAARVGVRTVLAAPGACEAETVAGAEALRDALAAASRAGAPAPRLIAASTSEVYAESASPLREDSSLRPLRAAGRWRYAASKRRAESILDGASAAAPALHLRFFNVVGPGQDARSGMVLPRFVESALRGAPLPVHGTGAQVRTFAHVDAAAADIARLTRPDAFADELGAGGVRRIAGAAGPLNVGGTARTTIRGLAERVLELGGAARGGRLEFLDPRDAVSPRFEEVDHRVPDLARLAALGLGRAPWSLDAIVADALARHPDPAGHSESAGHSGPAGHGPARGRRSPGAPPRAPLPACASPAS